MDDRIFMKKAIGKAMEGIRKNQSPFGAVIADSKGKVIAAEHNHVLENNDPTAHAEMSAIRGACKRLKRVKLEGCTIYSTTEPCPMCFSAIHWAGIGRIVYGCRISDAKEAGFSELTISNREMKAKGGAKVKVKGDFMRRENLELFRVWGKRRDTKTY